MTRQIIHDPSVEESRLIGPDLIRGLGVLLLLLTNVPLILTPIRYNQAMGGNLLHQTFLDNFATLLFLSIPPMTGMAFFILPMGLSLLKSAESSSQFYVTLCRLSVIGAIGVIHGLFVWWGDILFYYLIAGFIALYFRAQPPFAQLAIGVSIMFLPLILTVASLLSRVGVSNTDPNETTELMKKAYQALSIRAEQAYTTQNWLVIQEQRLDDWLSYFQDFILIGIPQLTGLLLVGMGIFRFRLSNTSLFYSPRVGFIIKIIFISSILGYMFQFFVQIIDPQEMGIIGAISECCKIFAPPSFAIAVYISILRNDFHLSNMRIVRFFARIGQYTLTIYIGSSILCGIIAYGFAIYGRLSMSFSMGISVLIFSILSILCIVLNSYSKKGPMEILVRSIVRHLDNYFVFRIKER